jgi:hypothetical protein
VQIISVSVTSHNPHCAEEMRGSNHFMLTGSGNQSEPHTSQFVRTSFIFAMQQKYAV